MDYPPDPNNIVDWFEPHNIEHMRAYKQLSRETGMWPKDFLPKGIILPPSWHTLLAMKIADCWIDTFNLSGKVLDICSECGQPYGRQGEAKYSVHYE